MPLPVIVRGQPSPLRRTNGAGESRFTLRIGRCLRLPCRGQRGAVHTRSQLTLVDEMQEDSPRHHVQYGWIPRVRESTV